ncbi:MAG: hypothetical protein IJW04_05225 [Ruminococcus sp.]|nr:hypothetical protein [Ruminococcus sp.]
MKYCEKCYRIVTDNETCTCGSNKLSDLKPQSSVRVVEVKGSLRAIAEPALKEKGIPFEFFNPEMDIYTQYNPKVNRETDFSLLVPFEFYNEAFEVCVGLGLADPEEKTDVDENTQISTNGQTYEQRFEEATGTKRKSFQILWIILFIVVACLIIWGVDLIAALLKGNIYDIPFIDFL